MVGKEDVNGQEPEKSEVLLVSLELLLPFEWASSLTEGEEGRGSKSEKDA